MVVEGRLVIPDAILVVTWGSELVLPGVSAKTTPGSTIRRKHMPAVIIRNPEVVFRSRSIEKPVWKFIRNIVILALKYGCFHHQMGGIGLLVLKRPFVAFPGTHDILLKSSSFYTGYITVLRQAVFTHFFLSGTGMLLLAQTSQTWFLFHRFPFL